MGSIDAIDHKQAADKAAISPKKSAITNIKKY